MTEEIRQQIKQGRKVHPCEIYAPGARQLVLGDGYFLATGEFIFVSARPPTRRVALEDATELHLERGGIHQGIVIKESRTTPEGRLRCVLGPIR